MLLSVEFRKERSSRQRHQVAPRYFAVRMARAPIFTALLFALPPAGALILSPMQLQFATQHQLLPALAMVSHRKAAADKEVDAMKLYEPADAIAVLRKSANAKFVETVELHGNLNLNPKYADQQIRTTVLLPHGTGKSIRVAVSPHENTSAMRNARTVHSKVDRKCCCIACVRELQTHAHSC